MRDAELVRLRCEQPIGDFAVLRGAMKGVGVLRERNAGQQQESNSRTRLCSRRGFMCETRKRFDPEHRQAAQRTRSESAHRAPALFAFSRRAVMRTGIWSSR